MVLKKKKKKMQWVNEVTNFESGIVETTAVHEVIPGSIRVAALTGIGLLWKIFPESVGVIGGESMPRCEAQSGPLQSLVLLVSLIPSPKPIASTPTCLRITSPSLRPVPFPLLIPPFSLFSFLCHSLIPSSTPFFISLTTSSCLLSPPRST